MPRYIARVKDFDIHYHVTGQGETLVLLHGMGASSLWWRYNIAPLAAHFRVVAVDLLGFGRSRGPFLLQQAAASLADWLRVIDVPRAHFVGHSMGGFIALQLAAESPGFAERLVLANPVGIPFQLGEARGSFGLRSLWTRLRFSMLPVMALDAWRAGPRVIAQTAHEIMVTDLRPQLPRIQAPTLILWGEQDHLVPRAVGEGLAAGLARGRLRPLPNAGHNCMWEDAPAFNQAIVDFLTAPAA